MIYDFRLVKAGYGDLTTVRNMPARTYLQALAFEKFQVEYETTYLELNKPCP